MNMCLPYFYLCQGGNVSPSICLMFVSLSLSRIAQTQKVVDRILMSFRRVRYVTNMRFCWSGWHYVVWHYAECCESYKNGGGGSHQQAHPRDGWSPATPVTALCHNQLCGDAYAAPYTDSVLWAVFVYSNPSVCAVIRLGITVLTYSGQSISWCSSWHTSRDVNISVVSYFSYSSQLWVITLTSWYRYCVLFATARDVRSSVLGKLLFKSQ